MATNAEIFGRYRHQPRLPKFRGGGAIREIQDIRPGDYAVHEYYGIGRYKGLELLHAGGHDAEYLKLEYAKGDRLYVPLYDFKQVQKYSGSEGGSPRLSSLDTSSWERVKARVQESIQELAKDLLKVHAARAALPGHAYPEDSHLEQEFGSSFLYEETPDQIKAIDEVKKDMESTRPMDRLILGDVGYGKTEVAMRAAFKAVNDSKQVAVLVPTTILAEQHYRNVQRALRRLPGDASESCRASKPTKRKKKRSWGWPMGPSDIVIGTHKLLQKGIVFKDLGLLIIDEEHRFGVKHKEQIKKLRQHLDVLTLTATPIPRTLSFAMAGMRELSIIETPPTGRLPITTHVGPYEDAVVKEAIQKELDRKGQVFYVHNRVQSMNQRLHFLKGLMPGVSIGVVHGQMSGAGDRGSDVGIHAPQVRHSSGHQHHRIRDRYPDGQHPDRGGSRGIRPVPALPAARARRAGAPESVLLSFLFAVRARSRRRRARGWRPCGNLPSWAAAIGSQYATWKSGARGTYSGSSSTGTSPRWASTSIPSSCRRRSRG